MCTIEYIIDIHCIVQWVSVMYIQKENNMIKSLAELKKKLDVGVKLKMIYYRYAEGHKYRLVGSVRPISIKQSNSIAIETTNEDGTKKNSWLYFGKSGDYKYTDKGFIVMEDGKPLLEYEIVE